MRNVPRHTRGLALAMLLASWAATARADDLPARRSGRGMMIAGIVLTGAGLVLAAPGIAFTVDAVNCRGATCDNHGGGLVEELGGSAMIALGGSLILTGVPLWIVGQMRYTKARLSLAPSSLALRF